MSEADDVWRVEVDGTEHEIELEHTVLEKRTITVDATVIEDSRKWGFGPNEHEWDLAGHRARIKIGSKCGGLASESSLHVDGRYVEPLRR